ncbi:UNVERIFIED_CONTAM: cellulose binding domain-containing protein [Acetivibrio alkalicellulosi]
MGKRYKTIMILMLLIISQIIMPLDLNNLYLFGSTEIIAQDDFDMGTLDGGTGWSNNWSIDGFGDIASDGYFSPYFCMKLSGRNTIAQRKVNLSGYKNVTLSYYWSGTGFLGNDNTVLRIFDGQWHVVHTIGRRDTTGQYLFSSIDLSSYNMIEDFEIQFITDMRRETGSIFIDNIVVSGTKDNLEPQPTLPPSYIKVEMYNANKNATTNSITPYYKITNISNQPINLEDVKIRYYYTVDGETPQNYNIYWSSAGTNNVTGEFVKMLDLHPMADYYLELGFKAGTGTISPGEIVYIQSRIHKTNWSNYSQLNDYSFNSDANSYEEWIYVTGYINDVLVWGIEPHDPGGPTPTPFPDEILFEFYNANRNTTTNTIYPYFKITNVGQTTVNLKDITMRYYYTVDGELIQNFVCDWSTVGRTNVIGTFVKVLESHPQVDYYLEIGFSENAGYLSPGSIVYIQSRIYKINWSNYIQSNDYSFNNLSTTYAQWEKVTGYLNNKLIWGIEPFVPEPTPTPTPEPTPTPIPTEPPTPIIGEGTGLRGEYYNSINFTDLKKIRIDPTINFGWGYESPVTGVGNDAFSVRWIGKIAPKYSEQYTFYTVTDGGVRIWIDNILIIDKWVLGGESSQSIFLMAGEKYDIKMEYFSYNDESIARLSWSSDTQEEEIVPQSQLYPPKIFTANMHNVRTGDNRFIIGDLIPIKAVIDVFWQISNPVISIDLNLKKNDGSNTGFIVEAIKKGNTILKDFIKIYVNQVQIEESDYTVWIDEIGEKINIQVLESLGYGDRIEIRYVVKATATENVFNIGIDKYLTDNNLENIDLQIKYEISQWIDSGLVLNHPYSAHSVDDANERNAFIANVIIQDPILLE